MGISAVSAQQAWAVVENVNGMIAHTVDGGNHWTTLDQLDGNYLPGLCTVSFVPEPATLGLLGLGALALLRRRRGSRQARPS